MEEVKISKKEYERLKKNSRIIEMMDPEASAQLRRSLEDIKKGRVKEWKPSSK